MSKGERLVGNYHRQREQEWGGCTVMCAVGSATGDGRAIAVKNRDVAITSAPEIVILANSPGNNKYLGIASVENPANLTLAMNDKGVIINMAGRYCLESDNPGVNSGVVISRSIRLAGSGKELADIVKEIVTHEGKSKNGTAFTCLDAGEAYIVEAYQKKVEISGPLKDTLFTYGNYMLTEAMKPYEKRSRGRKRAKRALDLMETQRGGVTVPFMMTVCRDHERPPDASRRWDDNNICTHGSVMDTRGSGICVADRKHPALLSALWAALNLPCRTPYLPFYIGMTSVPEGFATAQAYETFESLGEALGKVPALQPEVRQYWEAFELQTLREAGIMEDQARKLIESGKAAEAAELLTQFAAAKAKKALTDAAKLTKKILRRSIM